MLIEPSHSGTRLGIGHPLADAQGYAKDDPPQEAIFQCGFCLKEVPESQMGDFDPDTCDECCETLDMNEG